MDRDTLADKSRVLEERFYRAHDQALLEHFRSQAGEPRVQLAEISRIDDVQVLDELMRLGIGGETFVAFTLLPLIRIAWADRNIQANERAAILQAAQAEHIETDSSSYRLLDGWLEERPDPKLLEAWSDYARALARELDPVSLAAVRQNTLDRVRRIAVAAGGILGLGNRISKAEELAMADLAHAFDIPDQLH